MSDHQACRVCGSDVKTIFSAIIRERHSVKFFRCSACGFVQTEEPYWLEEAYREPIGARDTGILARNADMAAIVSVLIYWLLDRSGRFVDYGGGYGVLTRMMRDIGFDYYLFDRFATNLFAKGYEYDGQFVAEGVTAFEVFEHLPNPARDLEEVFRISGNVIFSTQLLPDPVPAPEAWWYYALDRGTHVSFYTVRALEAIAERHGLHLRTNGRDLHMFTTRPVNRHVFSLLVKLARRGLAAYTRARMSRRSMGERPARSARD
jgi:hypothetical protein